MQEDKRRWIKQLDKEKEVKNREEEMETKTRETTGQEKEEDKGEESSQHLEVFFKELEESEREINEKTILKALEKENFKVQNEVEEFLTTAVAAKMEFIDQGEMVEKCIQQFTEVARKAAEETLGVLVGKSKFILDNYTGYDPDRALPVVNRNTGNLKEILQILAREKASKLVKTYDGIQIGRDLAKEDRLLDLTLAKIASGILLPDVKIKDVIILHIDREATIFSIKTEDQGNKKKKLWMITKNIHIYPGKTGTKTCKRIFASILNDPKATKLLDWFNMATIGRTSCQFISFNIMIERKLRKKRIERISSKLAKKGAKSAVLTNKGDAKRITAQKEAEKFGFRDYFDFFHNIKWYDTKGNPVSISKARTTEIRQVRPLSENSRRWRSAGGKTKSLSLVLQGRTRGDFDDYISYFSSFTKFLKKAYKEITLQDGEVISGLINFDDKIVLEYDEIDGFIDQLMIEFIHKCVGQNITQKQLSLLHAKLFSYTEYKFDKHFKEFARRLVGLHDDPEKNVKLKFCVTSANQLITNSKSAVYIANRLRNELADVSNNILYEWDLTRLINDDSSLSLLILADLISGSHLKGKITKIGQETGYQRLIKRIVLIAITKELDYPLAKDLCKALSLDGKNPSVARRGQARIDFYSSFGATELKIVYKFIKSPHRLLIVRNPHHTLQQFVQTAIEYFFRSSGDISINGSGGFAGISLLDLKDGGMEIILKVADWSKCNVTNSDKKKQIKDFLTDKYSLFDDNMLIEHIELVNRLKKLTEKELLGLVRLIESAIEEKGRSK